MLIIAVAAAALSLLNYLWQTIGVTAQAGSAMMACAAAIAYFQRRRRDGRAAPASRGRKRARGYLYTQLWPVADLPSSVRYGRRHGGALRPAVMILSPLGNIAVLVLLALRRLGILPQL